MKIPTTIRKHTAALVQIYCTLGNKAQFKASENPVTCRLHQHVAESLMNGSQHEVYAEQWSNQRLTDPSVSIIKWSRQKALLRIRWQNFCGKSATTLQSVPLNRCHFLWTLCTGQSKSLTFNQIRFKVISVYYSTLLLITYRPSILNGEYAFLYQPYWTEIQSPPPA